MAPVDLQVAGFVASEEPDGPTRSAGGVGEVRRARSIVGRFEIIGRSVLAAIQKPSGHGRPPRAPLVADAELFRHRSKYASLRHAARCALENSKTFLSDANSIMILTDPTGLIIDTQGDARVIDAGRTVHLEHGGRWSEADIGTNAIGAAMAESRPVQIHGTEHFCSEVQRWTCAAVPVHDPADGELLGVVDISGPASTFNPQSLALAVSVGHHVESVLAQSLKQDHEKLLCHFLAKRSLWVTEECIVLDRRGAILHATERGHGAMRATVTALTTMRRPDF